MVILSSPILILFIMKAIFNQNINWDAIRYVAGYVNKPPSFVTVAASTFLFSGYLSLLIFNRLYTVGFKFHFRWVVLLFGAFIFNDSFFCSYWLSRYGWG